mmetsp:Transcript_4406/g.8833  ORF Transcript_4406/g.8833 Transcript_4406/m.8833 type:complete len:217 (-) Transcript_4406:497-1147(-)
MRAYISAVATAYAASRYCLPRPDKKRVQRDASLTSPERACSTLIKPLESRKLSISRQSARIRKPGKELDLDDSTVMRVMEFSDLPSTIALMGASKRVRDVLKGKLKKKFWEMAFWRDRGILLYLSQASSLPRSISSLPADPVDWTWRHYLQAYYSSTRCNPQHLMFGRCEESRTQYLIEMQRNHQVQACKNILDTFEDSLATRPDTKEEGRAMCRS